MINCCEIYHEIILDCMQKGKIKRIVIPLDKNHLLYMTTTRKADHNKITTRATKLKLGKIRKTTRFIFPYCAITNSPLPIFYQKQNG